MDGDTGKRLCSICLETFKNPKIIPCYHTFCEKCLDGHIRTQSKTNKFSCPLCRDEISVPVGGASAFKNNFYLDEIDDEQKCSCSQGEANYYCKDCILQYCARCIIRNHRLHNVVELTDFCEETKEKIISLKDELHTEIDKLQLRLDDLEFQRGGMVSARDAAYEVIDTIADKKCLKIREKAENFKQRVESLCKEQDGQISKHKAHIDYGKICLSHLKRKAEESLSEFTVSAKTIIPEIETALQDQRNKVYLPLLLKYPIFSMDSLDMNASLDLGTLEINPRGFYTAVLKYLPDQQSFGAFQCNSRSFTLHNLNWTIQSNHHDDTKSLGIYICLNQVQPEEKLKSCIVDFSIKLVNESDDSKSVLKRFTKNEIVVGGLGKGWYKFVDWSEFVDTVSGYLDEHGNFTLVISNLILKKIYQVGHPKK